MPSNKVKIAKNALALYARMGIILVVSLYTARVVLQQLGASDYGVNNVVGGIVTMLSFMTGTLSLGVQRFINFHKGKDDYDSINKTFWSALVIMMILGLIIVILAETLGLWFLNAKLNIPAERMYAANWVYQFSILSMIMSLLMVPFNAIIVSHEDFGIYAYVSIAVSLLNLGISFLLQIAPFDKLIFYSGMMSLLQAFNVVSYVVICRKRYRRVYPIRHKDKNIYQSLLSFSGWNILGTTSFVVSTQGVNMILNIFFGTIVNAARGVANQVCIKIDEFINNIQQAVNPQIVQLYSRGEMQAVQSLVYDNFRWNFSLYWLIALPILFEADYILAIWLGEVPEYTSIFLRIIVLRSLVKCFERPINSLNFAIGDMKRINIFASVAVLFTIVLLCVLFKLGLPPYWAFVLDVLCVAICTCFYMSCARRHNAFSFRYFGSHVFVPIFATILISSVCTYFIRSFFDLSGFGGLLLTLFTTTIISLISLWFIVYSRDNRTKISSVIKSKIASRRIRE